MTNAIGFTVSAPPVWLLRAGHKGRYATDFILNDVAAIGWPAVGDLRGRERRELVAAVKEHYGEKGASGTAGMLWRFANEIAPGDLVLTPDPETRELHAGTVIGEYEFRPNPPVEGYPNVRSVDWSRQFSRDDLPKWILYQLGSLLTVSQPSAQAELRAFLAGTSLDDTGEAAIEAGTEDDPRVASIYTRSCAPRPVSWSGPRSPIWTHIRPKTSSLGSFVRWVTSLK